MFKGKYFYVFLILVFVSIVVPLWYYKSNVIYNDGFNFVVDKTKLWNKNIYSFSSTTEVNEHTDTKRAKIRIGVLIPSTARKVANFNIANFSLIDIAFKSFYKTIQPEYNYTIYVGIDINDTLNSYIRDIGGFEDNIVVVHVNGSTFTNAVNTIAEKAVQDGADYLMRINDDTQFVTSNWTSLCIESLQNNKPPNIGVVGPLNKNGKQTILTLDFVHVTHFHIFGFYYPPQLDNWWADDWITRVYEPSRSKKLLAWTTIHKMTYGVRYRVDKKQKTLLNHLIDQGNNTLQLFLTKFSTALPMKF
ncbi:hypothetical protein ACF0H5_008684 [Mactra antiquata]